VLAVVAAPRGRRRVRIAKPFHMGWRRATRAGTIAARLQRTPSTISREIRGNDGVAHYRTERTERRAWHHTKRQKGIDLSG